LKPSICDWEVIGTEGDLKCRCETGVDMEVDVDDNDRDPVASLGCNDDDVCFFGRCTRNKKLGPLWVTTLGRHYTASCRWCSASAIVIACRARAAATASAAACRPAAVSPKQLAPELLQHHPSQPPPKPRVVLLCDSGLSKGLGAFSFKDARTPSKSVARNTHKNAEQEKNKEAG